MPIALVDVKVKARWTAMAVIVGYAAAIGSLALIAPTQAWAKKSSIERLVEKGYANLTAEKPVKVESAGELEVAFSPNGGGTDLVNADPRRSMCSNRTLGRLA